MRLARMLIVVLLAGSLSGCTWLRESWPWRKKDVPVTPPSETNGPPAVPSSTTAPTAPAPTAPAPTAPVQAQPSEPAEVGQPTRLESIDQTRPAPATEPATVPAMREPPAAETGQDAAPARIEAVAVSEGHAAAGPYATLPPAAAPVTSDEIDPLPPPVEPAPDEPAASWLETATRESAQAPAKDAAPPAGPPAPDLPPLMIDGPVMLESLVSGGEPQTQPADRTLAELAGDEASAASTQPTQPAAAPVVVAGLVAPKEPAEPDGEIANQTPQAPALLPPQQLPVREPIEYGKEEVVAASLLQVNDEFVTVDDLLREASEDLAALPAGLSETTFRTRAGEILNRRTRDIVVQRLVQAEAKDRISEQQQAMIDEDVAETQRKMMAEAGGSPQKLAAVLARRGTDLETVLAAERRRLTVQAFLQARFYPAISVTRRMLWDYYRDNPQEFTFDKKVQMQIIAVPYESLLPAGSEGASEDERRAAALRAERQINEALTALRSGEDFAAVARRLSRGPKGDSGGLWPMMSAGSFRETKVEDTAFALEEGQTSGVIETATGYYVVKARKVDPGRTVPFEQAQEQIDRTLRDQQFNQLQEAYFRRLLAGAQIRQSDEFQTVALDRAVRRHWQR